MDTACEVEVKNRKIIYMINVCVMNLYIYEHSIKSISIVYKEKKKRSNPIREDEI